jgi:hypothetical protein
MIVLKKTYDALNERFKKAVTDLAEARCSLEDERASFNQRLADAIQDYEADALKWRASLKRSRDRKAAKKEGV